MPASGGDATVTSGLSARPGDRFSRGEAHLDAQAAELRALEAQLAVVQGDLLGDDRQAEAGARGVRRRSARERLEDVAVFAGRDAGSVVVDGQHERLLVAPRRDEDADPNLPTRAAVQRRVVEQVVDDEAQAAAPAAHHGLGRAGAVVAREPERRAGVAAPG